LVVAVTVSISPYVESSILHATLGFFKGDGGEIVDVGELREAQK